MGNSDFGKVSTAFEFTSQYDCKINIHNRPEMIRLIEKHTIPEYEKVFVDTFNFKPVDVKHNYSDDEISQKVRFIVFEQLSRAGTCKRWIRDAVKPDVFFTNYEELMTILENLIDFEGYFPFYKPTPSEMYRDYKENKERYVNEFIDRWYPYMYSQLSKLKTEKAQYDKAVKLRTELEKYEKHFSAKNIEYLNTKRNSESAYVSPKKQLVFDSAQEKNLLNDLNRCKKYIDKHFAYIALQDFYYKYREDSVYLNKCIKYCLEDISILSNMNAEYKADEIKEHGFASQLSGDSSYIDGIKKYGFSAPIPAYKRLCIIYEKQKDYTTALKYCNEAIDYYKAHNVTSQIDEFVNRKEKLSSKISGKSSVQHTTKNTSKAPKSNTPKSYSNYDVSEKHSNDSQIQNNSINNEKYNAPLKQTENNKKISISDFLYGTAVVNLVAAGVCFIVCPEIKLLFLVLAIICVMIGKTIKQIHK
ncbi:MAG: tetratricopeptide repeat protein [Hominilimicola sp.]